MIQDKDITSTSADPVIGKADWLTVLCVTPIVEGRDGVPEDDARRFRAWLGSYRGVDGLIGMVRSEDRCLTVLAQLAEAYAYYIETEFDTYSVELMCRTVFHDDGSITIDELPTPSERMARMKEKVGQEEIR